MKNLFLSLVLITSIFFSGVIKTDSAIPGWTPPEDYRRDDSQEKVSEPSVETTQMEPDEMNQAKDEMSMKDIFGSEQVFPFEPGLGNSAF